MNETLLYYGIGLLLLVVWYYDKKRFEREGMNFHPFSDTSFPNPTNQISGNRWTENAELKSIFNQTDVATVKFDNFDIAKRFRYKLNPFKLLFYKKAEIYIQPLKLTESVTMVAPMNSGKTVTMQAMLDQPWYKRALVNDEKSGDFVSKNYNKRKDIIFCPYDERSHVWDVLSEDLEIVEFFIQNTISAVTGNNQSFFTNDAKERYKILARLTIDIEEAHKKWDFFINELAIMFDEVESADQKSAKDVTSTMKQIIEMLKFIKFQIDCGKKTFTINSFFELNRQNKLFMVNVDKYNLQLNVLFSAFTACFAMIHASRKESEEDLTFYLLDEYLSLKMNYEAKVLLHTKIRSKGGCLLCALHYFPDDQKVKDLLTSSTFAYLIFSIKNENTRNFFSSQVGEFEYIVRKKLNNQYNERTEKKSILKWDEIDKIADEKQHVTYIPSKGALFVAKSDYKKKKLIHKPFILDKSKNEFYRQLNDEYLSRKKNKQKTKSAAQAAAEKEKENKN